MPKMVEKDLEKMSFGEVISYLANLNVMLFDNEMGGEQKDEEFAAILKNQIIWLKHEIARVEQEINSRFETLAKGV